MDRKELTAEDIQPVFSSHPDLDAPEMRRKIHTEIARRVNEYNRREERLGRFGLAWVYRLIGRWRSGRILRLAAGQWGRDILAALDGGAHRERLRDAGLEMR